MALNALMVYPSMVNSAKFRDFFRDFATPYSIRFFGIAFAPKTRFLFSQRNILMENLGVDYVLDIGANIGQFALELRRSGFEGKILSVEPLSDPFRILQNNFGSDDFWTGRSLLIGEQCKSARIEKWGDSSTASVLQVADETLKNHQYLNSRGFEISEMKTLECFINSEQELSTSSNIFLKLDVQGYEEHILATLPAVAHRISIIQLETSLSKIYEGGSHLSSTAALLDMLNYTVVSVMTERFQKKTLRALDTDLIAVRNDLLPE
jgi:FkbM family methyltransferase